MAELKVWQYTLPSIKGEGWAYIMIREDGFFAAVSDWGNYAHGWWNHGCKDVREFFLRMDRDCGYFASKFEDGRTQRIDAEKSTEALRNELLLRRRQGWLTKEQAASDWEQFELYGEDWEGLIRQQWHCTDEPWGFAVTETSRAFWFCKHIGPRLTKLIQPRASVSAYSTV